VSQSPLDRYAALRGRVDDLFASVHARHGDAMQCGAGCADCCHARFSVTLIEAAYIASGLAGLPAATRAALAERAAHGDPGRCAALDAGGRCQIYAWRPLVCRSHGAPIRRTEAQDTEPAGLPDERGPAGRTHLPVIDCCPRNFDGGRSLSRVAPDLVFDQRTLSTVLGALDAAFADRCGAPRGMRIDLAALVGDPDALFEVEAL
jgi:uncharacterized protein